jgi:HEAT repeat protein
MPTDAPNPPQRNLAPAPTDRGTRRRTAAIAGHVGDEATARAALEDPDPAVRGTAIGALTRLGALDEHDLRVAVADPSDAVRRRAAQAIATMATDATSIAVREHPAACAALLQTLLDDPEDQVVEVAAWATGEWIGAAREAERAIEELDLVRRLEAITTDHPDALCREAAVAALGAIGDERSLPAILRATEDKATVRRRAVIALAPFDGPEVDAALVRAREDRDWQVRQAAEDLLAITGDPEPGDDDPGEDDPDEPDPDPEIG